MLDARTLVLDDERAIVELVARCLHETVREVDTATNTERALALFELRRHAVVVLDLVLPQMGGFEVMQEIHRIDPRAQVIIVTGYPTFENAKEAVNRHAFGFLVKPFTLEELQHSVIAAFAHYQERSAQPEHPPRSEPDVAEIEALYREVATLSSALERSPSDPELQSAYRQSFARLRSVQMQEAELASRAFRDSLALKKGMGYSSIEAARRMLDHDKNSA